MLGGALVLQIVGALVIRKIINIKFKRSATRLVDRSGLDSSRHLRRCFGVDLVRL